MTRATLLALALLALAAPAVAQKPADVAKKILDLSNAYRVKHDSGKLELDKQLSAIAQAHAQGMADADKYGDDDKNGHVWQGKTPADRAKAGGYKFSYLAENVGWNFNQPKPADVIVQAWIESKPHEKNLVNKELTQIGIGAAKSKSGKWYFVQLFGTPAGAVKRISVTIENKTKETIKIRIGGNKYEMKPGESATVNHATAASKIQIAITWPGDEKETVRDLTDKASYVMTQKDKAFAFEKVSKK